MTALYITSVTCLMRVLAQYVEMVLPGGERVPCRLNTHMRGQGRLSGNWLVVQDALGLNRPDQVPPLLPLPLRSPQGRFPIQRGTKLASEATALEGCGTSDLRHAVLAFEPAQVRATCTVSVHSDETAW